MTKPRFAGAFGAALRAAEANPPPPVAEDDRPVGGAWSRQGFATLERNLIATRQDLEAAHRLFVDGVLAGTLPIPVPAEQIDDLVGSDRVASGDAAEDPEFQLLVENIRSRGLRTPLRLRPLDPDWRPDPEDPRNVDGQRFALQSGRRRLAACRQLGIVPFAYLSFEPGGQGELSDLHERYFENVVRKDLKPLEKFYSIGLIAAQMPEMPQTSLAGILGVPQANISRGVRVLKHFEALRGVLDADAGWSDIDRAMKRLAAPEAPEAAPSSRVLQPLSLPFRNRTVGRTRVRLTQRDDGSRLMTLSSPALDDTTIARIMAVLARG
jgi:ParB-like chromosome segregation protein Spo0J